MNNETKRKGKASNFGGSIKNKIGKKIILPARRKHLIKSILLSDCLSKIFQEAWVTAVKIIKVKRKGVKFFYKYQ